MKSVNKTIWIFSLFVICSTYALEINKQQRYNQNTDFLAHEAGGTNSAWGKRDYVAPNTQINKEYDSQFPSLGSASGNTQSSTVVTSTTKKPGLRDYVAPQIPTKTLQPQSTSTSTTPHPQVQSQKHTPSGKRDYVAPQVTTRKPDQENSGRVKDLINFYDDKSKHPNGPNKTPSYSSILQNNNQKQGAPNSSTQQVQQTTPKQTSPPNTRPSSFSSVVAGNNKGTTTNTATTSRPSTHNPANNQGIKNPNQTERPGSTILPSSIINKNTNQQNGNGPTDAEIQILSEELLRKDTNNAAKYITVNYQEKTTSQSKEDKAPLPLLVVAPEAWNLPTIQKLVPLLDNYERDTMVNEYVTPQERSEENAFMDVIMNTAVIRHLMSFLKDKGYVSPDPRNQRDFLKQLWFNLYSRGKGKISSSGFEHVFVSELKNGDVQGLHNWVYFSREEAANRANYLGYLKYQQLGDKGAVLKLHFNQQGADKPVDTIFIGTSPELEIALYTLCFVTRADRDCPLKLASKDVNIVTYNFRYRSKNYIGSAYPQI